MIDCCLKNETNWFRYRVGAIIIEDNHILFAKNELEDYYYSVGGGVKMSETSEDAVVREVIEETGIEYEISHLSVIHENFFNGNNTANLNGFLCHEISFYYVMKPKGNKNLNSNSIVHGVKEEMCWLPIKELHKYKIFPAFLKDGLEILNSGTTHIVTNEIK